MENRMRALILGAALALGGCGGSNQAGNTTNLDQTLAAQTIASNDVTAIDAVTGEDSNMAADVALINALDNVTGNTVTNDGRTRPATDRASPSRPTTNTSSSTANTAETATTNNSL